MAIRQDDDTLWFVVTSGIAEIGSNTITLLTDAVLQATDEVDAFEKLDGIQANTL
jgi:F0F1-type ATP synthase epsilon subunit